MAAETFETILQSIQKKQFSPFYIFYGEEEFFIDRLSAAMEESVLAESEKAFNQNILYGKDITSSQLIETCRRLPMMAERQLVLIREAQSFQFRKEEDEAPLLSYLKHPTPSTVLVFAFKHGNPDKRKNFYKELIAKSVSFESKKLYENQVGSWVKKYVGQHGFGITEDAVELLVEFTGNDLSTVSNELSKIFISKPPKSTLSYQDIEQSVGMLKEFSVFELNNALGSKQVAKAFRIANYFKSNPKSAPLVMMLGTLHGFFVKVFICSNNRALQDADLARILKVSPFFVKDYRTASQHYSPQKLAQIFQTLAEFDLRSKGVDSTNNMGEGEMIRELIYRIIQ
jgi:DNA polymerase-3 subunit delta